MPFFYIYLQQYIVFLVIRLNYSSSGVETNALWTDFHITASGVPTEFVDRVRLALTSSFSQETFDITGSILSNKTDKYGGWILFQTSQSAVPTSSGQYFGDLQILNRVFGLATWDSTNITFTAATQSWETIYRLNPVTESYADIADDRVYVSGSNDPAFTDYVSVNENATFNVYQN